MHPRLIPSNFASPPELSDREAIADSRVELGNRFTALSPRYSHKLLKTFELNIRDVGQRGALGISCSVRRVSDVNATHCDSCAACSSTPSPLVWRSSAAIASCWGGGKPRMPKRANGNLSGTGSLVTNGRSIPSSPGNEMRQLFDGAAFGAVFESSGEALLVIDSQGRVRRANHRSHEMLRLKSRSNGYANLADFLSAPSCSDLVSWCSTAEAASNPGGSAGSAKHGGGAREWLPRAH